MWNYLWFFASLSIFLLMNIEHRAEYTVGIWQKARVSEIILWTWL